MAALTVCCCRPLLAAPSISRSLAVHLQFLCSMTSEREEKKTEGGEETSVYSCCKVSDNRNPTVIEM